MIPIRVSIVTYNSAETIRRCIESVRSQRGGFRIRISIVDNASQDETVEVIRSAHPDVEVNLPGSNVGFGSGHNRVLRDCEEPYALLINPDAWLLDGALERLVDVLESHEDVAVVAPRMEYEDGRPQASFGRFPGLITDLRQGRLTRGAKASRRAAVETLNRQLGAPIHPDWVSGSCFLARVAALGEVGFFDERYFLYLEDVDLCRRLSLNGWRVRVEPAAVCRHVEGHSSDSTDSAARAYRRSRLLYENKFGTRLGYFLYRTFRARDAHPAWDDALRVRSPR